MVFIVFSLTISFRQSHQRVRGSRVGEFMKLPDIMSISLSNFLDSLGVVGLSEKDNSKGGYYGYVSSPSQGSGGQNQPSYQHQLNGSSYYNNSSGSSNGRSSEVLKSPRRFSVSSTTCLSVHFEIIY